MAFYGLWPYLGAVQTGGPCVVNAASSASVTWGGDSTSSGGWIGIYPFLGAVQGSNVISAQTAFSITSSGAVAWNTQALFSGRNNLAASSNILWTGVQLSSVSGVTLAGSSTLSWASDIGAAFYININQTEMSPTGASVANADWISPASAFVIWEPTQVPTGTLFEITGISALTLAGESRSDSAVSIASSSALTMQGIIVSAADFLIVTGTGSFTWSEASIAPAAPFSIIAEAIVAFASQAAVHADVEWYSPASMFGIWNGQEIRSSGPLIVEAIARLRWASPSATDLPSSDDDDRRTLWMGAAQAEREQRERQMASMRDEDDLIILAATLAKAYEQWRH